VEVSSIPGLSDLGTRGPKQIYVHGQIDNISWPDVVAVVGSRRMTTYGERAARTLVSELVGQGRVILSGLMYGVDKTAHRTALSCGGRTIAVLGWGIKNKMTYADRRLTEEIVSKKGLVISEWEDQLATRWTFPLRDRIMAALSRKIYVVEAAEKSGALITAEWGIRLGREIWAIPGPVTSLVSFGPNKLISQGKAKIWVPGKSEGNSCNSNHTDLYTLLQSDCLSANELAVKLSLKVERVVAELSLLELMGKIGQKDGKFFAKD
jgi:DNA processing protein